MAKLYLRESYSIILIYVVCRLAQCWPNVATYTVCKSVSMIPLLHGYKGWKNIEGVSDPSPVFPWD
jgi:hypothetical protein